MTSFVLHRLSVDPLWPLGLQIEGYTTYTPEQAVACEGP